MDLDELFSLIRIGHKELKNRIALVPTGTGAKDDRSGARTRFSATVHDEEKIDE
jgi:2,4-dienoyl-CoA reductase-like NADH-dependent reductase (Old Yellow Enzyme family)